MLSLRPVVEADLADLLRGGTAEGSGELQWFGYGDPGALRRKLAENGLLTAESGRLVVDVDGAVAGSVQWFRDSWGPPQTSWCWEIGIKLLPEHRGQGHGTEAQRQLVAYLFAHTTVQRVQACTEVLNVAEQRALEAAGFEREGVLRSALWRSGAWRDAVLYSVLRR